MLRIHYRANFYFVRRSIMHVRFNLNINQIQWVRIFFILLRHPVFLQWLIFDKNEYMANYFRFYDAIFLDTWQKIFFNSIFSKQAQNETNMHCNVLDMRHFHPTCNIRHIIFFIQSYVSKNIRLYCILHPHK